MVWGLVVPDEVLESEPGYADSLYERKSGVVYWVSVRILYTNNKDR
jgi:hypothetical protein